MQLIDVGHEIHPPLTSSALQNFNNIVIDSSTHVIDFFLDGECNGCGSPWNNGDPIHRGWLRRGKARLLGFQGAMEVSTYYRPCTRCNAQKSFDEHDIGAFTSLIAYYFCMSSCSSTCRTLWCNANQLSLDTTPCSRINMLSLGVLCYFDPAVCSGTL